MLFLVELTRLDTGVRRTESVDGAPDLEEHARVVGADELGPDDPGVRSVCLLDEEPHRGRVGHDVVVAEHEERGALDEVQRLVGRGREAGARIETPHERVREARGDPCGGVVVGTAVDDEHA